MVGDWVLWAPSGDEGVVESIEPRRNLLFRQDEWRSKSFAANLDAVLVLLAVEVYWNYVNMLIYFEIFLKLTKKNT